MDTSQVNYEISLRVAIFFLALMKFKYAIYRYANSSPFQQLFVDIIHYTSFQLK